jgi:hypothetical protein
VKQFLVYVLWILEVSKWVKNCKLINPHYFPPCHLILFLNQLIDSYGPFPICAAQHKYNRINKQKGTILLSSIYRFYNFQAKLNLRANALFCFYKGSLYLTDIKGKIQARNIRILKVLQTVKISL